MNISYKLPLNIVSFDKKYFKFDNKYLKYENIKVTRLNNVFVNHYGLVLKNLMLVNGCAPNIKFSNYDSTFYYKHWRKATEQYFVCKFGKSLKSLHLSGSDYFLIHSPWFSYYFWITECIPRLIEVYHNYNNEILIYPNCWDNFTFVKETLTLFPKLKLEKIPVDYHLFVENLIVPEVKPWTIMFRPKDVLKTNELLLKHKQYRKESKRICIVRQGTHRSFDNFKEVNEILTQYNFELVKMENISFFEQIAIMQAADIVVGISGAGHTNIHFMKNGAKFLDITAKKNIETKKYKFHFWKLACIVGVDYYYQFAEISNHRVDIPYYNRNIIVNLLEFNDNIKKMINE
jgi:capsular polysaccharide biosynthesis protein